MERGRDKFSRMKGALNVLSGFFGLFSVKTREKLMCHYRMKNGYTGLAIRYALLKTLAKSCGDNVSIHTGVYLFNIQNLSVGNNVSIHPMCYIQCGEKGINIGNDVSLAQGTTLFATRHTFMETDIPIKDQGIENGTINIEDDVLIGSKATVLANCTIRTGSIIGANAVVTRDILENSIAVGVPAKVIKKR